METITQTVAPHLAVGALVGLHPTTVAVHLKLLLPYLPKAILVNVALVIVAADAETSRDGAIGQHRGDVDTRAA